MNTFKTISKEAQQLVNTWANEDKELFAKFATEDSSIETINAMAEMMVSFN